MGILGDDDAMAGEILAKIGERLGGSARKEEPALVVEEYNANDLK